MRPQSPRPCTTVLSLTFARAPICLGVLLALTCAPASLAQAPADLTADIAAWRCMPSDGVEATIRPETRTGEGDWHPCLRLDFNFKSGGGFVVVQRDLALDLPENYEFSFNVRAGEGVKRNNLEFKLLDPGQPSDPKANSVWWVIKRGMEFPAQWTPITYKRRHFSFAWGPSGGAPITRLAHVEFAISSSEGGQGTIWFDALTLREIPAIRPYTSTPTITASTSTEGHPPAAAMDADPTTTWSPNRDQELEHWLTIDFGQAREINAISLQWVPEHPPVKLTIQLSDDGTSWRDVSEVDIPAAHWHAFTPDNQGRFLKLRIQSGGGRLGTPGPALKDIRIASPQDAPDLNGYMSWLAREYPRGWFPRWVYGEQSFWTVVGVPDDTHEALINEEGQIEVDKGAFSLEPFIWNGQQLLTWADATHEQNLIEYDLPFAVVKRHMPDGLDLVVWAWADGTPEESALFAVYSLRNTGSQPARGKFFLTIRPYQVDPPWQFLNAPGGIGRIRYIRETDDGIQVDDRAVFPLGDAANYHEWGSLAFHGFHDNDLLGTLARGNQVFYAYRDDPDGLLSGEAGYPYEIPPGELTTWAWAVPFTRVEGEHLRAVRPTWIGDHVTFKALLDMRQHAQRRWRERLSAATLSLPPSARAIQDTFYAQQAYILINKDGPGFQPGSRSYERSWMRDGSLTSAAMLQLGHTQLVKDFLAWYAGHQFPDGKVPCVVDSRGPDPVPENDSHGQLIMAFANYHRYTHDTAFVREQFEHVRKAVEYIQSLRAQRTTGDYDADSGKTKQEPGKPPVPLHAMHGLMPESISHEGYSAKPMSSYWDDLFTYRGLKDAAYLAGVVGDTEHEAAWRSLAKGFAQDLVSSYAIAMKTHGIDYLPGCVELGDFDATSTTVALWPVQAQDILPAVPLRRTFDKYWEFFRDRRDNPRDKWEAYTPYEWRCVNAMVHLGMKRQALEAMDWFFLDQYPPGWRHWAEVVWSSPRTPKFIGDMPHTWVGSDFLNSLRSMLVYEDEAGESLVLLAGVPEKWLSEGDGMAFRKFRTYYGTISVEAKADAKAARIEISGDVSVPTGGLVVRCPLDKPSERATVNGKIASVANGSIVVRSVPAVIEWLR